MPAANAAGSPAATRTAVSPSTRRGRTPRLAACAGRFSEWRTPRLARLSGHVLEHRGLHSVVRLVRRRVPGACGSWAVPHGVEHVGEHQDPRVSADTWGRRRWWSEPGRHAADADGTCSPVNLARWVTAVYRRERGPHRGRVHASSAGSLGRGDATRDRNRSAWAAPRCQRVSVIRGQCRIRQSGRR